MHILYIARETRNRRLRYAKELKQLGHKVDTIRLKSSRRGSIDASVIGNYDLIFILSVRYFQSIIQKDFIKKAAKRNIPVMTYYDIQADEPFSKWVKCFKHVTHPYITNKPMVGKLIKASVPAKYMPFGYYADLYYPIGLEKKYDVTFMGRLLDRLPPKRDRRSRALNELVKNGVNVEVWTRDPDKRLTTKSATYSTHEEQNKVYNLSKINLDLPWINTSVPEYRKLLHLKNRFIEVPGSGGFLLTKRCAEFESLFREGTHCEYYHDMSELLDKIKYYLKHESERERIAQQGYKLVKKHFQFKHMLKSILDDIFHGKEQTWDCPRD